MLHVAVAQSLGSVVSFRAFARCVQSARCAKKPGLLLLLFKHQQQRAQATYMPVK